MATTFTWVQPNNALHPTPAVRYSLLQAFRVAPKVCDAEESELASCYMWLESVGELMFCEVDLGQGETEASW